jgi:hypothetical protein
MLARNAQAPAKRKTAQISSISPLPRFHHEGTSPTKGIVAHRLDHRRNRSGVRHRHPFSPESIIIEVSAFVLTRWEFSWPL